MTDQLKTWGDLTSDEQDLFKNPHAHISSSKFTTSGFGLRDQAIEIINGLDETGKKKALEELNISTGNLDQHQREYDKGEVAQIRGHLRELGIQ